MPFSIKRFRPMAAALGVALLLGVSCLADLGQTVLGKEKANVRSTGRIIVWWLDPDLGGEIDQRLAALDLQDRSFHVLTERQPHGSQPDIGPVVVSPDGKMVAYVTDPTTPEGGGIVTWTFRVRRLDEPAGAGLNLGVQGQACCWSPDGTQLLVLKLEDDQARRWSHKLVDVKTKEVRAFPLFEKKPPAGEDWTNYIVTDWSRDGQWLLGSRLVDRSGTAEERRLVLIKSDGSQVRPLPQVGGGFGGKFSPDGKRVLYGTIQQQGEKYIHQLYVAPVDGGKPVLVSHELNGDIHDYCWSPDSRHVAYVWIRYGAMMDEPHEVFLMAVGADGKNPEVLMSKRTPFGICFNHPNWQ